MGYLKPLKLPRLGETMEQGRVLEWLIEPGTEFSRGQMLLEVETDKTIVEVPALEAGTLIKIIAEPDTTVVIDEIIAQVEVPGEPPVASAPAQPGKAAPAKHPAQGDAEPQAARSTTHSTTQSTAHSTARQLITPRARTLAHEYKLDTSTLEGSGRRGRIIAADVLNASGMADAAASVQAAQGRPQARQSIHIEDAQVNVASGALHCRYWEPEAPVSQTRIVLLHGLFGDVDTWSELAHSLARSGHPVMAADLPSHGSSTVDGASLAGIVAALGELLNSEPAIVLVGHSLGGYLATRVATGLPGQLKALVLMAPLGLGATVRQSFLDSMTRATTTAVLKRELASLTVAGQLPGDAYLDALREQLLQHRTALQSLCREVSVEGIQQVNIEESLDSLPCPISLIWGRSDTVVDWQQALNSPPQVALHLQANAGHMPMSEATGLCAEVVQRYC